MMLLDIYEQHRKHASKFVTDSATVLLPELVKHADQALRGGVRLTLSEWSELNVLERAAFVQAGDELAAVDAQRIGVASSGPLGAALATQCIDDGAAAEALHVEAAHAAAVAASGGVHRG